MMVQVKKVNSSTARHRGKMMVLIAGILTDTEMEIRDTAV